MNFFRFAMIGIVLGFTGLLGACAETPREPSYAQITFRHLPSIALDVGEIKFVNEYRSPLKAPHVEHEMPVKIEKSIERWTKDRLKAVGKSTAYAVVTLKEASVIESELPKGTGLRTYFTTEQSEKYDFKVQVEVKVVSINGSKAFASATAEQSKTMPEDRTLNERDQMFFERTEILMREFNTQMEKNIYTFLAPYLK